MKKVFFSLFLAVITLTAAQAQQGFKAGGGINLAVPIGDLGDAYSIGAGLDLMAHYGLSDNFAITGDVGYTALFPNSDFKDVIKSSSMIPLRAGIRFYPASSFFLGGKIGAGFGNTKLENGTKSSGTATAWSFGAGYSMDPKLEIGASYDGYSEDGNSTGMVNLRLGYWFGNN